MSTLRNGKRHQPDKTKLPQALQCVVWHPITSTMDLDDMDISDGMAVLVAVPVCDDPGQPDAGWHYELSVVDVGCDEHYLSLCVQGDPWGWDLDDADWYVVLSR